MQARKDALIFLHPDIVHRSETFGGILFNLETKDFYPLNGPAYRLVQLLDNHPSVKQVEDFIQSWYAAVLLQSISYADVERICATFLDDLQRKHLIRGYPIETKGDM